MNLRENVISVLAVVLILGACTQPPAETPPSTEAVQSEAAKSEPPPDPTPEAVVATGVFTGRSGKPIAKARLYLAEISGDEVFFQATVKLVPKVSTAVTDEEGGFQFKGFIPGTYTIAYQPPGVTGVVPVAIATKTLSATDDSIMPLLRDFEIGTDRPFSERAWGRRFTLLKGHTLYSMGPKMKIWNASVRYGQRGPYLEIRRGLIWTDKFEDNSEIRFEAWSY